MKLSTIRRWSYLLNFSSILFFIKVIFTILWWLSLRHFWFLIDSATVSQMRFEVDAESAAGWLMQLISNFWLGLFSDGWMSTQSAWLSSLTKKMGTQIICRQLQWKHVPVYTTHKESYPTIFPFTPNFSVSQCHKSTLEIGEMTSCNQVLV